MLPQPIEEKPYETERITKYTRFILTKGQINSSVKICTYQPLDLKGCLCHLVKCHTLLYAKGRCTELCK